MARRKVGLGARSQAFKRLLLRGGGEAAEPIYINAAPDAIMPVVGENTIPNGDFSAWTDDHPDGWVGALDDPGGTYEITERDPDQLHADVKTVGGACNFWKSTSGILSPSLRRDGAKQRWTFHQIEVSISAYGSGALGLSQVGNKPIMSSAGVYVMGDWTGINGSQYMEAVGPCDFTVDYIYAKPLSNVMASEYEHKTPLSFNQCELTIPLFHTAGIYHKHKESGDFIAAFINRLGSERLCLRAIVNGSGIDFANVAITYADGKMVKLDHPTPGRWVVYYDTPEHIESGTATALIDVDTVLYDNIDACNENGRLATIADVTFANYKWQPNPT